MRADPIPEAAEPLLSVEGLGHRFGGVRALDGASLDLRAGEAHGLVGENGAGKSTLIKALCGILAPQEGRMTLAGRPYRPASPRDAKDAGVQVVHQELNLLPDLTVAENVGIEALPRGRLGLLDRRTLRRRAREALGAVGLAEVNVDAPVRALGIAHRQLVEIARALQADSRVLILDEPTATLTDRETRRLFATVEEVVARGVAVLFVSHHLDEVFHLCARVTVMRGGATVSTAPTARTTPEEVVGRMVGGELAAEMARREHDDARGPVALALEGLRTPRSPHPEGVSLEVRYGEILGVAGLVGSGRSELLASAFGAQPALSGRVLRDGRPVRLRAPSDAIAAGMGFVTEDRKDEGLILPMPIAANVSLARMEAVSRRGLLSRRREEALARERGEALRLRYGSLRDPVSSLSGGNQQKVVLAKWLASEPRVLLLDEPTRGVDVGAKAEIYAILRGLAERGLALLLVSSEIPELVALADRVVVMARHRVVGELGRDALAEEAILRLAYDQGGGDA